MALKRGSLVPVAEVVSGLNGPVKAIRDASPQALHHFTQADQVNQLVSASEADPERGFMARTMALCFPAPYQPRLMAGVPVLSGEHGRISPLQCGDEARES